MKKQLVFNRPVWIFLLFLVGSFLFVDLNFRYWFHFMEQFMLFQTTSVYWKELAAQLGGWNEYIAEYLTQAGIFLCCRSGNPCHYLVWFDCSFVL